ncbi:alcohol dehydrogenase family protein [Oceanispirochaeta sp.]|uniref:alcohol dehydrogenase family protein n=1 Tax=Oceanispirochaeta sp. TaxID=2035350 RepID=UPI0026225AED|nr:alcohol dehydrogenase family protein [Oceanispirochaeta sp.]MDA3956905.1 alcohol dehydrogenase family protein [Oceanispirochaeta sp.]
MENKNSETAGKDRFDLTNCTKSMKAVVTTGNGGYEKLEYRDVPIPEISEGEVLLQVLAAGVNNTEINTRLGWYSSTVTAGTESLSEDEREKTEAEEKADGGWNGATPFPYIQGTDCCGRIVQAGPGVDPVTIGSRVLIRACIRSEGWDSKENIWMASDFDGAFAQFVKIAASEVFPVNCDWSDAELGTIPCAYGTAENMIHRSKVSANEHVLVTGASGGVGSAVVQLAKRRGAIVTAIAGKNKMDQVHSIGADRVIPRGEDILSHLGEMSVDVVVDNVGGSNFNEMMLVLKRGGRYASSGAIAGPLVTLDMRNFYLKDLTLIGCTAWDEPVFPNLISYIEKDEIKPLLARTFPLEQIVEAQKEFTLKKHVGNFVLIPQALSAAQRDLFGL